jgi:ribosomal-protein-alanine N-acetyltransferase
MVEADVAHVCEIAQNLKDAPHWPLAAYLAALDPVAVPCRIALVATAADAGPIIAFTVASLLPPQAELETIAVAVESQRRGLARQLFAYLTGKLKAAQISELLLEVRASNRPALAFYRALGFEQIGQRPRYYANPVEDAFLMRLII